MAEIDVAAALSLSRERMDETAAEIFRQEKREDFDA
jgi:hypothetical protein